MKLTRKLLPIVFLISQMAIPFALGVSQQENKKSTDLSRASIDINQASAKDFTKLPSIGPELARRIVTFREKHGPFRRVEDLLVIRGIGPRKWKALRPYLRVESHSQK